MKNRSILGATFGCLFAVAFNSHSAVIYTYSSYGYDNYVVNNIATAPPPPEFFTINGYFIVDEPLAPNREFDRVTPLSYEFSDFYNTYNNELERSNTYIGVSTDEYGQIDRFQVTSQFSIETGPIDIGLGVIGFVVTDFSLSDANHIFLYREISSVAAFECVYDNDYNCIDIITNNILYQEYATSSVEGAWSYTVVPVPAAAWLFGSGLLGLVGIARLKAA